MKLTMQKKQEMEYLPSADFWYADDSESDFFENATTMGDSETDCATPFTNLSRSRLGS